MSQFPTVGLGVDLSGIDQGKKAYAELKAEIAGVGAAAEQTAGKVEASATKTKSAAASAVAGQGEVARAATASAARQVSADAEATAAAERNRKYLQGVRIRSLQMEEAARAQARMAEAAATAQALAAAEAAEAKRIKMALNVAKLVVTAEAEAAQAARATAEAQIKAATTVTAFQKKMWAERAAAAATAQAAISKQVDAANLFAERQFAASVARQTAAAEQLAATRARILSQLGAQTPGTSAANQGAARLAMGAAPEFTAAQAAAERELAAASAASTAAMTDEAALRATLLAQLGAEIEAETGVAAAITASTTARVASAGAALTAAERAEISAAKYLQEGVSLAALKQIYSDSHPILQAFIAQTAASGVVSEEAAAAAIRLKAAYDPVFAALQKLNAVTAEANALRAAGALSGAEEAAIITRAGLAYKAAQGNVGGLSLKVREFLVIIREISRGDVTRLAGSASILAQAFGLITAALVQNAVLIGAAIAPFVLLGVAMVKGEAEMTKFRGSLIATGNYAGMTASRYEDMAQSIAASSNTTIGSVRKVLEELVASGKFSSQAIGAVTDTVANYAKITGKHAQDIAKEYDGMKDHLIQWAVKHEDVYHDLTVQQLDHVANLIKEGKEAEAQAALLQDIDEESKRRLQEKTAEDLKQMGYLEDAMQGMILLASKFWDALLGVGRGLTLDQKISAQTEVVLKTQDKIQAAYTRGTTNGRTPLRPQDVASLKADLAAQVADLQTLQGQKADEDAGAAKEAAAAAARHDAIQKKYGDGKSHAHTPRTDGIENQIAKALAEVQGLNAQVDALLAHPGDALADFTAQIDKARAAAVAASSHGPRSAFAQQAGDAAALKEEATLRLQIVEASNKQVLAEQQRAAQAKIAAQGDRAAFADLQAYYQSGSTSLLEFIKAQDAAADALLAAKLRLNDYTLAIRYGVTSVDQISAALVASGKETKAHADQIQQATQNELTAANAADRYTDALHRQGQVLNELSDAQRAFHELQQKTADVERQVGMSPEQRAADALVTQGQIRAVILKSIAQGVNLTEAEARAIAAATNQLELQRQKWAQLKLDIADSIRAGFIDTGKISFKSLRKRLTEELRAAVYDALLAKPIDIIVNAAVSMTQQLENQFIQPMGDAISKAIGLGGSSFSLANSSGGLGTAGGATASMLDFLGSTGAGSLSGNLGSMTDSMGEAAKSMKSLTGTGAGSLASTLGMVFAGDQIGGAVGGMVAKALGINQGAGAQVGALGGAAIGMVLGGPIGAMVGGAIGDLVGGLFDNKPTNGAAFAKLTPNSAFYSTNAKTSSQAAQLASTFGQEVISDQNIFKQAGIQTDRYVSGVDIGTRDVPNVTFSNGVSERLGQVGDAAAAAAAAMKEELLNATYASDAQKQFVMSMINAGDTLDTLSQKLQEYGQSNALIKGVDRSILKIQNPQAGALADLQDQQIARRQQAIAYYQDGVMSADDLTALQGKLKTLEQLEIVQTISQFNDGLQGVTATLSEFKDAQQKIVDYAKGLLVGQLSPLSPQDQLNQAGGAFWDTLKKAQGGDKTALDNVTGTADTYLNQAHSFYASSAGYVAIFNQVQAALQALGSQAYPAAAAGSTPSNQDVVDALAQLQAAITAQNADLITAIAPAANDATASSSDIASQTTTLVASLQEVTQAIGASAEAITGAVSNLNTAAAPLDLSTLMSGGIAA